MEMNEDTLDSRLKGIADEIRTEDASIIKKPMITLNDDLKLNEYSKKVGTPFKQQKLSAWQPILTANTVLPWLLTIGIFFLPIGVLLLNTSARIQEFSKDYTDCLDSRKQMCKDLIDNTNQTCICEVEFELNERFDKDIFLYYGLINFYQNHRRYVRSRNDWQLLGYTNLDSLTSCIPFDRNRDEKLGEDMLVAPCGAIANSIFNDTFELYYSKTPNDLNIQNQVPLLENEISWPTDRKYKFKNPQNLTDLSRFTHPKNWKIYLDEFKNGNKVAFENEHLIVWMRSAALPNFRKLYARIDHTTKRFKYALPKGKYIMKINYNYPVKDFGGKKSFILSNTSWLGGKNPFLGYAYIITGCLCILIAIVLFFIYKKFGVREREMIKVDQNTPFRAHYSNLDQSF